MLAYLNRDTDASRYDSTTYPPLEKVPPRYAIVKRNEWMVCESDVVISGVTHSWGGASKTLEFAQRKNKVMWLSLLISRAGEGYRQGQTFH